MNFDNLDDARQASIRGDEGHNLVGFVLLLLLLFLFFP